MDVPSPLPTTIPSFASSPSNPTVEAGAASAVDAGPWRPSFTQGILLGQASMVLLAILFLKYVVFENPETARTDTEERWRRRRGRRSGEPSGERGGGRKAVSGIFISSPQSSGRDRSQPSSPLYFRFGRGVFNGCTCSLMQNLPNMATTHPPAAALLNALSYDLATHPSESLDWLNVLLAQLLASYRSLAAAHFAGGARALIEEALNRKTGGGDGDQGVVGIDYVEVEEVELGDAYPVLSAARVRPSGIGGEGTRVELDLDYVDRLSVAVSTRVVMNFPRPRFAILPVSLALSLERFSGTLTVELPPPNPSPSPEAPLPSSAADHHEHRPHPSVHLSLHPDFDLLLRTSSLLGSRAKLQDVPKIEQLLNARIRAAIQDRVVWPGRVEIALPGLSRPKTASVSVDPSPPSAPGGTVPSHHHSSSSADSQLFHRPHTLRPPLFPRTDTDSSSTPDTPSVDLSAPEGPSIALHPHLRRSSGVTTTLAPGRGAPSPTESLPGYFPSAGGPGGRRLSTQDEDVAQQRGASEGMRFRGAGGRAGF
ncbi:hypothetical protein JCM6882_005610 [Rhodosporidiobolus microsporus]